MKKKTKSKPTFDISKHILVPKHTKLTKKEQQELFNRYNITHAQLLKIYKDDVAIAHLELEDGDVVKIERKGELQSPTAGVYNFYRGVVDAQK